VIVDNFPVENTLQGVVMSIDNMPLCGTEIFILDTLLLLKNEAGDCEGSYFYLYDFRTMEFLCDFGTHGRGPNEFVDVLFTGQYLRSESGLMILIPEESRSFIREINLTASVAEGSLVAGNTIRLPDELSFAISPFMLPDKSLLGRDMMAEGRFFFYQDGEISLFPYFPAIPRELPPEAMVNIYASIDRLHRDNNLFVSSLNHFKQIDLFHINAGIKHYVSIRFPDSHDDIDAYWDSNSPVGNELMYYYTDIQITDNYIYGLYYGKGYIDYDIVDYGYSELHVFDHQGHPVAKYHLNHTLHRFAVTNDDTELYGVAGFSDSEPSNLPVVRYSLQLKELLSKPQK
jgi:hypothetical protein